MINQVNVYYHLHHAYYYFSNPPFSHSQPKVRANIYWSGYPGVAYTVRNADGTANVGYRAGYPRSTWDSDTIQHEYTHSVIQQIFTSRHIGLNMRGIGGGLSDTTQARAMDEGLADFFAAAEDNNAFLYEWIVKPPSSSDRGGFCVWGQHEPDSA